MKFLILVNNYPDEGRLYAERFVHARVVEYLKEHECRVASFKVDSDYMFEGVPVFKLRDERHFYTMLTDYLPDRILVHFALKRIIQMLKPVDLRIIVWVHGYEALGWYRRWFELKLVDLFSLSFIRKLIGNARQQLILRQFISRSNASDSIRFVFVSEWMRRMTESDTWSHINQYRIIPNPIDDKFFRYQLKDDVQRFRILVIRPFNSLKYALDMVRDTILALSGESIFPGLQISIYGEGPLWEEMTARLKPFKNIHLFNHLLNKAGMAEVFFNHGILLCPSRQDAQGVTMCEAMSCGLVPVTSNHTGLPEFVQDGYNGYTTSSVGEMADRIKQLLNDPESFQRLSHHAATSIRHKAGIDEVIRSEMSWIMS